jgi:hypothetical protein
MAMDENAKAQLMEDMDGAAKEAGKELVKLDQAAVKVVRDWWKANYMKAGHKRLGRVLLGR